MKLTTQQSITLQQLIMSYTANIIQMYVSQQDTLEQIKQYRETLSALLSSLVVDDKYHRFWSHPPTEKRGSLAEKIYYDFWALIHRPEKLAKELSWIAKDLDVPSAEETGLLQEIQQTAKERYSKVFDAIFSEYIERSEGLSNSLDVSEDSVLDNLVDSEGEEDDACSTSDPVSLTS